jgi:hypothetical protein
VVMSTGVAVEILRPSAEELRMAHTRL